MKYLSHVVPEDSQRRYEGPDEARNSTDGIDGVAHSKGDSTGGEAEDQVGKHEEVAIWGHHREDENIEDKENGLLESVLEDSRRPVDHRLWPGSDEGIPRLRVPHSVQPDPVNGGGQRGRREKGQLEGVGKPFGGRLKVGHPNADPLVVERVNGGTDDQGETRRNAVLESFSHTEGGFLVGVIISW